MSALAQPTEALESLEKKVDVVPQGYTPADEMIAIDTLLAKDRPKEARQRLRAWLDRYVPNWRAGSTQFDIVQRRGW